jgi:hypothetical protein
MKRLILLSCFILATTFAQAQYILVPSDYASIQEGINAAGPGDIVVVSDGIYYGRINFMGKKQLTVASQYILDGDESHIANTILDGSQIPYLNKSVVIFTQGEDTTTVLCGFTIRNGQGTLSQSEDKTVKSGGAIYISGSGAKIIHNHILQNHLNYNPLGNEVEVFRGAGIATEKAANDNWVIVDHNVIEQNTCISDSHEASGGGLSIWGNAIITGNTINNNVCKGYNNSTASAAGLFCGTDPTWDVDATVVLKNNTIAGNRAQTAVNNASYGGACIQHAQAIVQGNIIMQNTVKSMSYGGGIAGLGIWIPLEGSMVSENTFSRNISDKWSGALSIRTSESEIGGFGVLVEKNYFLDNEAAQGGGLTVYNVPACLQNNVFSGNKASGHGGAIIARRDFNMPALYVIVMVNNSFYNNSGPYGGAIYSVRSKAFIVNSIFQGNSATIGDDIFAPYHSDTVRISHTDIDFNRIYGNTIDKGGNFTADPLFEDQKLLTLSNMSPCIDKGDAHYTCNFGFERDCPRFDITNQPRMSNNIADLGANEFNNDRSLEVSEVSTNVWQRVYPNPVTDQATFEYWLEDPGILKITIYDNAGRNVAVVVNEYESKGVHKIIWNTGILPAGLYIYRLETSDHRSQLNGKIVIAR